MQLVEQARQRAGRVAVRPETIARLEETDWFRACQTSGRIGERAQLAELASQELLAASAEALFTVGPVFPLGLDRPSPSFESVRCEACGESVLAPYAPEVGGRHLCTVCEERRRARALFVSSNSGGEPGQGEPGSG